MADSKSWHLYMVRTANGHLYTGITTDVPRRIAEHESGKGAKYLRGKGPLQLAYTIEVGSYGDALKREIMIKKMRKEDKERIASGNKSFIIAPDAQA